MMRFAPALLLLAACARTHEFRQPATVTLLGAEGRLETWEASAAESGSLHATLHGYGTNPDVPDEALILDFPLLEAKEEEREFAAAEFKADYLNPVTAVRAMLETGRARVKRLGEGRYEFELFLVMKPAGSDPAAECLQVVSRFEAGPERPER